MIKFNPENKESLTYGECLEPAMQITDEEEAKIYFKDYVEWQTKHFDEATGEHTPEEVCRINLGYFAGYYGTEVQKRIEKLFLSPHPVFSPLLQ